MNFSIVDAEGHIKGLHYHLKQDDIWFVPPPSKAKFVLFDVRKGSPTFGKTQVIVAGGGQDLLVRIPAGVAHGYRPLTNPCALIYFVTETFDPAAPDELRIAWDHPAVRRPVGRPERVRSDRGAASRTERSASVASPLPRGSSAPSPLVAARRGGGRSASRRRSSRARPSRCARRRAPTPSRASAATSASPTPRERAASPTTRSSRNRKGRARNDEPRPSQKIAIPSMRPSSSATKASSLPASKSIAAEPGRLGVVGRRHLLEPRELAVSSTIRGQSSRRARRTRDRCRPPPVTSPPRSGGSRRRRRSFSAVSRSTLAPWASSEPRRQHDHRHEGRRVAARTGPSRRRPSVPRPSTSRVSTPGCVPGLRHRLADARASRSLLSFP